jgi:O-antigen biosynthesis protein
LPTHPLNVVMVIDGRPTPGTADSLGSLQGQMCDDFRLTIAYSRSWQTEITALLEGTALPRPFDLVVLGEASDFSQLLHSAISAGAGHDVALIYSGDVWAPDTTAQLSAALAGADVVYADEDCLDSGGMHSQPRLKPSYSPEYLLHTDCVGRPLAMSADVAARLPPASAQTLASRDHDLALRACETAHSVHHISEVLCHRRVYRPASSTEQIEDTRHVDSALARRNEHARAVAGVTPGTLQILRTPKVVRSASIIIPFRDEPQFLRACFDSIERTRRDVVPEYFLIDNGSDQPETTTLLERLSSRPDVHVLRDDRPFNWAKLNNTAAGQASGDVLVFLNNDIEARTPGWLDALCAQVERPEIGAVGARLLYPDHRVQHCGVVLGLGGAAGHLFVGLAEDLPGYLDMAVTTRECSAVTGACLATRRSVFEQFGGFDESLGIDLNDIDYCLRMWGSGRRIIYESRAELVHRESPSRGTAGGVGDIVRFVERWKGSILAGDPYLNAHLTRVDSSCALREPGEDQWWQRWHAGLSENDDGKVTRGA